ncbi:hypothetical protein ACIP01_08695 [Pseudomonas monteilii]|uniref:hypothetical protein n=1 Tax=Pseudomonas monteilii TaxID=76759 RepID=UPI0038234168
MSVNPIEHVLARMDKRNITKGWGAVAAFSRSRLNDLLHEQYQRRLSTLSFLPLFNADVYHEDHIRTRSVLRKVQFGAPLLSFANASLSDSRAQLTFPIVAGVYRVQSPLAENLVTRFIIDESMGYSLVMDIELRLVKGSVDRLGRVTLDLAEASSFNCNLAGEDQHVNGLIAAAMQAHFEQLPKHRGQFELGMLDFSGYSPLSPTHFRILTQPAPGAQILGADNYGDGAVLTFIQLRANAGPGTLPEYSFPYLIPDDLNDDGSQRYSATMVVDKAMLDHVRDEQRLDVLASLLFNTAHRFEERERHTPHDLAVFGNVVAVPALYAIKQQDKTVPAGGSTKFTLIDQAGNEVTATNWYAQSRQSHTAAGDGEIDGNGFYQAVGLESIGHHSLTILITAELVEGKQTHRVTAQLVVQFEQVQVAPRVGVFASRIPMVLGAAMPAADVEWSLLGHQHGQLAQTRGNRTAFTAEKAANRRQLGVQQVQAKGGQQRVSTLVMLNGLQSMFIEPARAVGLQPGQVVSLKERDLELLPGARRRWQLIGPGELDDAGRYTAPTGDEQGTSVVTCELVQNGVVLAAGYSLLEYGEAQLAEEKSWVRLSSYTISIPGGAEQGAKGELLNNGFQSLRLQAVIQTEAVDGKYYRLNADERASIGLTMLTSKQRLQALSDDNPSGGIEVGDPDLWATRQVPNRFDLAYAQLASLPGTANEEAITRQDIYLHCTERAGVASTLYSTFYAEKGGTESSDDGSDGVGTKVVVTPKAPPEFTNEHYELVPVRVAGAGGEDLTNSESEAYTNWLRTLDYWAFKLRGGRFETVEFLPQVPSDPHISKSMIRWESEHKNEIMFSFTGAIFRDKYAQDDGKWQEQDVYIDFDGNLNTLMSGRSELNTTVRLANFDEGSLVITNHRVPDFDYKPAGTDARDQLARDVAVLLRDRQGNAHYRRFSYPASDTVGDRNIIHHSLFSPK